MFNLLPGSGLGFTGSKLIAFGLGPVAVTEVVIPPTRGGGSGGKYAVYDNAYSVKHDDDEIIIILSSIIPVISQ